MYADDLQLYVSFSPQGSDSTISKLNKDLKVVSQYTIDNCLKIYPEKTQAIHYIIDFNITLNGHNIKVHVGKKTLSIVILTLTSTLVLSHTTYMNLIYMPYLTQYNRHWIQKV
nr:unnamed protein product [Callosobruchus analis]